MRRFNLLRRTIRCWDASFHSDKTGRWQFGEPREPICAPERSVATFAQGISAGLRRYVLDQGDLFCRMCGVAPGDIDDLTGCVANFHIGFLVDKDMGGKDESSNLSILCSTCDEGSRSILKAKPTGLWLLSQVRRAGQDEQRAVLRWLRQKFKD
jgi:hypothetical protein